ncbi:MAG: segregation/condensation protein A [Acidobacteria bacterium]|nr:segregation/condensation protein A [Acidobacteriota bacterium]
MSDELLPPQDEEGSDEVEGYRIQLPAFEGPLDLLLHLIRKHKIDIYDIPIMLVTEQYNQYLEAMEQLDLDIAADYIYMAALLIHIKSKMLLPRGEESDEQAEDPRAELVEKLLEYQRFKAVAESFAELDMVRMHVWSRPPGQRPEAEPVEVEMSEVSLFDLIDAFRQALVRYKHDHPAPIELVHTSHKVSDMMRSLVDELVVRSPIRLQWYLEGRSRGELVAIFLGVLELVRLGGISLTQSEAFGEIVIQRGTKDIDISQFAMFDH